MLKVEPQLHNAPPEHCYACLGTADRRAARRKTHKVRRAARARLEIAIYLLFYAVTVENSEVVLATVIFEHLRSQNAVARAGFDGFDCHQANEMRQKRQYYQRLLLMLLSIKKNHLLKRQYGKYFLVSVLSFYAALTVEKSESRIWTVDQIHYQQLKKEISYFLLLTQNKGLTPLWRQPLFRSVYQFAQKS